MIIIIIFLFHPQKSQRTELIKGILKLVLTYIFSTRDEGCFFSI
jgi:hypothetical protein